MWGAAGVSSDLPLAGMYLGARTLRLADGPDEVHKVLIAKHVLDRDATERRLGLRQLTTRPMRTPTVPMTCPVRTTSERFTPC